ncbi:unnamed protein product, partial [Rotaria magnacalcarata]
GTILGSAVFNVLFVIALCALISTTVCELDAYPIVRDAGFYCIAVIILFIIIYDQRVYWYEALALVLLYFIYVAILKFNDRISRFIRRGSGNQTHRKSDEHHSEQLQSLNDHAELEQNLTTRPRSVSESVAMNTITLKQQYMKRRSTYKPCQKRLKDTLDNHQIVANATEIFDPLKLPTKKYKILKWALMYPVRLLMHITIPDCRKEVFHNYYMLTFVIIMGLTILAVGSSIEEIFSAIVMTRRGHPEMAIAGSIGSNVFDILMGLGIPWLFRNLMRFTYQQTPYETVPLMGDSALATLAVGSSNDISSTSINTNIPYYVEIHSRGLVYSTIVLFVAILTFLLTFFLNRCRLTKFYGVFLIITWLSVITLMCLFELNVFGRFHAETCRK